MATHRRHSKHLLSMDRGFRVLTYPKMDLDLTSALSQGEKCSKCNSITAESFSIPPSWSTSSSKCLVRHDGLLSLANLARHGCELCRIIFQYVINECPSTEAERELGAETISLFIWHDHVVIDIGYFFLKLQIPYDMPVRDQPQATVMLEGVLKPPRAASRKCRNTYLK